MHCAISAEVSPQIWGTIIGGGVWDILSVFSDSLILNFYTGKVKGFPASEIKKGIQNENELFTHEQSNKYKIIQYGGAQERQHEKIVFKTTRKK